MNTMDNKGFKHIDRARQLLSFETMRFGKLSLTDIDGVFEYKDKAYVLIEIKYRDTPVPRGQEICLERMAKDLGSIKPTLVVVAEHYIRDTNRIVDVGECQVRDIYYSKEDKWRKPNKLITVRKMTRDFINETIEKGNETI